MRAHLSSRPMPSRPGGVAPLTILSLVLLAGIVALVVDGGSLMEERRHAQATADAAALAATADLYTNYATNGGTDPKGAATASAQAIAAANGFSNDGVQSVVTVNVSPQNYQSGPNAGTAIPPGYVEVIVQYNAGRTFSGIFGSGAIPVRARAVARGQWSSDTNMVILLNLSSSSVLSIATGCGLKVNGGLLVNTSSSAGINLGLTSTLSAAEFNVNQAVQGLLGFVLSLLKGLLGGPPTVHYLPPIADPLRYLPDPDPVQLGLSLRGTNLHVSGGVADLYPGLYNGGISISGGAAVTFHANADGTPGIYFLQGGGLTVSGPSSAKVSASETAGVMIYNDWQGSGDTINVSGSSSLTLSPPASGVYKGITLFQKRGTLSSPAPTLSITGSGAMNLAGTIYAAHAKVSMTGPSSANVMGGQIIADTLSLTGSATINIDASTKPIANTRRLGLVQ